MMVTTTRMLRRGGASLLAVAWLFTACSDPGDEPTDDAAANDAAADDTPADDTPAVDTPVVDTPADDTQADDVVDTPADDAVDDTPTQDDGNDEVDEPVDADDGDTDGALPRFVTEDTPDGRYTMGVDDSATLELPQGTTSPSVRGDAVEVFDVASLADSGVAQWEIRAIERGESTITAIVDGREHVWTVAVTD